LSLPVESHLHSFFLFTSSTVIFPSRNESKSQSFPPSANTSLFLSSFLSDDRSSFLSCFRGKFCPFVPFFFPRFFPITPWRPLRTSWLLMEISSFFPFLKHLHFSFYPPLFSGQKGGVRPSMSHVSPPPIFLYIIPFIPAFLLLYIDDGHEFFRWNADPGDSPILSSPSDLCAEPGVI